MASSDSTIDCIDEHYAAVLRGLSPAQAIAAIADANDTARLLAAAGIRYCNPDWTEQQVQSEVARRMLDAAD